MLDEKRLGAGVRPTFHNHPEERVVQCRGELDSHHIYRHGGAQKQAAQTRALAANTDCKQENKQVSFKQDLDRIQQQLQPAADVDKLGVGDNHTWHREYNPGLSQSHFHPMCVYDDKYMSGIEHRPNYGLYASIPKYNTRLHPSF